MKTSTTVTTIGPNGGVKEYNSLRAASRALSGVGSDHLRMTISRRCNTGGGYVGNVWVEQPHHPSNI